MRIPWTLGTPTSGKVGQKWGTPIPLPKTAVVTRSTRVRGRTCWRSRPRRIPEIEEVTHVTGIAPAIARRQRWEFKALLDEFQPGGVVRGDVRYAVSLREGGDDH